MPWRIFCCFLFVALLSACGFQLRGSFSLPFERLYIALPEASELRALLARNISAGTQAKVVDDAKSAQATFSVLGDSQQKNILSIGSDGRVREFQLVRSFSFSLRDTLGNELVTPSPIIVRRAVTFSDAAVLSKEAEEGLLWRDMQNDLVQQILRRLATAKVQVRDDK